MFAPNNFSLCTFVPDCCTMFPSINCSQQLLLLRFCQQLAITDILNFRLTEYLYFISVCLNLYSLEHFLVSNSLWAVAFYLCFFPLCEMSYLCIFFHNFLLDCWSSTYLPARQPACPCLSLETIHAQSWEQKEDHRGRPH